MTAAPTIIARDVEKTFVRKGGEPYTAFEGINFDVATGEFACLLGPSGCGKSTLLHLIAGFERPTHGEIRVDDALVERPGPERGVVFQSEVALFSWLTVEQNVEYGLRVRKIERRQRRETVERALALVGLEQHRGKFPRELSGGMKQRVQIARTLANDPGCLLMDEPFGALDAQTRARMQNELIDIWTKEAKTVVFVTHDVSEVVFLGDKVAVMSAGPAAGIRETLSIDLPRPRDRGSPEFAELTRRLTDLLHEDEAPEEEPDRVVDS